MRSLRLFSLPIAWVSNRVGTDFVGVRRFCVAHGVSFYLAESLVSLNFGLPRQL
jgi:hypothetical protein